MTVRGASEKPSYVCTCLELVLQGKHAEAEQLLERALAVNEAGLGADHKTTIKYRALLADLYTAQGLFDKASSMFAEIVNNLERVYGPDHQWVADILVNLAKVFFTKVRDSECLSLGSTASKYSLGAFWYKRCLQNPLLLIPPTSGARKLVTCFSLPPAFKRVKSTPGCATWC